MALPLVFTARTRTAWSPPLQHQDPATNATEVDCVHWPLYQALRPGSRTVAEATVMLLVVASRADCPKAVLRCSSQANCVRVTSVFRVTNRKRFARVRRLTACPKAFAVVASPEAMPSARLWSGGVRCCRSNERCGSPERNVIPQAESLHVPSEEGGASRKRDARKHEVHAA